jgi:hypothetical protein
MTAKEIWRSVPSCPGILASSLGRVMLAPFQSDNARAGRKQYGGVPTSGQWDGSRFIFRAFGCTHKVARLVCEAFNGAPPDGTVCMHLDENSRNNAPANLAWGTQKENLNAPGFIAYCKARTGENNPHIKGRRKRQSQAA